MPLLAALRYGLQAGIRDDRVILFGFGVGALGLVSVMRMVLSVWRDDSEIKIPQPKTQYITQDTEDSLKLGTLDTLLGHYNYAIRETAAKIVSDRAVNDGSTIDTLLWGVTREDYNERMRSLRTLALITDHQSLPLLHTDKAYSAFVRSLELCLKDVQQEKLNDKYFDEYYLRDMAEKLCLMFVIQLINKYGPDKLIRAKFIEKWLAKQNWGETLEERQRNFVQYMQYRQNRITEIFHRLQESRRGQAALIRSKLIPKDSADILDEQEVIPVERLPRVIEQSAEEQQLRHRHREAMVFNDGSRPLGRADIIEREHNSPT